MRKFRLLCALFVSTTSWVFLFPRPVVQIVKKKLMYFKRAPLRPKRIASDSIKQMEKELIPKGVTYNRPKSSFPVSSWFRTISAGEHHTSTFQVVPKHVQVANENSTIQGVAFNVETVPVALEEHMNMPAMNRVELLESVKETAAAHYRKENGHGMMLVRRRHRDNDGYTIQASQIKIEALSDTTAGDSAFPQKVVYLGSDGFLIALMTAFAQHLPLILSPDHVWILISNVFAKHVDLHSEELRKNFVQHEGKKRLLVRTPDDFAMSDGTDPDTGASTQDWETFVFPEFSKQIKEHIGDKTHKAIAAQFSTTTATANAAHEITLMSAMKNYFSYGVRTECGIPNITLLGKEQDWVALHARAEHLGSLMLPEFRDYWMPKLLPVLDEFVESYKGKVNHGFWQSMVKLRHTGGGSGSYSFISGWVQILFPYLASGKLNQKLRPWYEMYFEGPELDDFPPVFSTAPVDWEYYGETFDMTFHAGIVGCTQEEGAPTNKYAAGALSPLLGWYISHSPPKPPLHQLKLYKKERDDLLKGHKEEVAAVAAADSKAKGNPWYQRVAYLNEQITALQKKISSSQEPENAKQ